MFPSMDYDPQGDIRRKLLTGLNDRLAQANSLDGIIGVVRSVARAACSADGVTFVLRDGNKCHYVEEAAIGPGQKFPMDICISGWAMMNAQTAAIGAYWSLFRRFTPHDIASVESLAGYVADAMDRVKAA